MPSLPPQRWLAVGGAAAVVLLSLTGAAGYGPGAVRGPSPATLAVEITDRPAGAAASTASDDSDWLVLDDAPSPPPGKPVRTPDPRADAPVRPPAQSDHLPARSGSGKRVVYDESAQRVWLVRSGDRVSRTYLVSGSRRPDLLDAGRYAVYSKSRTAVSLDHRSTMNYMVRFARGERAAIGFHDIPAYRDGRLAQLRTDLGTPLSAGCIRQWITDARALWEFTDVGTRVVVLD